MMNHSGGMRYRVYSVAGRPTIAVPDSPKILRSAGIARYQPFSFRRAVYRRVMQVMMMIGVDRWFATTTSSPIREAGIKFELQDWLDYVCRLLDADRTYGILMWPPQRDRKRVFVHLLAADGRSVGFAKVAFDELNHQALTQEAQALRALATQGLRICRVPLVLATGRFQDSSFLITEATPPSARPLSPKVRRFPSEWVMDYGGPKRVIGYEELIHLPWWTRCRASLERFAPSALRRVRDSMNEGIEVCRIHGDFTRANIVVDDGEPWIFDWEWSCPDGPSMTDEISYFMSRRAVRTNRDLRNIVYQFRHVFAGTASRSRYANIVLSLGYESMAGIELAGQILSHCV